jgi:hypothetical protein
MRIDFISRRGPECGAIRRCPRFALFYTIALWDGRACRMLAPWNARSTGSNPKP